MKTKRQLADPVLRDSRDLVRSLGCKSAVKGLTHTFYRYPARFSPKFARAITNEFTQPGGLILDPFMGSGTTLVEAFALGRNSIGSDINSLANMIARVKTTLIGMRDADQLRNWGEIAKRAMQANIPHELDVKYVNANYLRHLESTHVWRLTRVIAHALTSLHGITGLAKKEFARCVILSTAQWALDCRKDIPTVSEFRTKFIERLNEMLRGAEELGHAVAKSTIASGRVFEPPICLLKSASSLPAYFKLKAIAPPDLVLTSPPYPGVHVLYHRWQLQSRRELAAPYWIANCLDGTGASHYTFGDRNEPGLATYFAETYESFSAIRQLCSPKSIVVQLIAFSQPTWQLPLYLKTMEDAGFSEFLLPKLSSSPDGRLWRQVPNRKWYAVKQARSSAAHEIVLFHKIRPN